MPRCCLRPPTPPFGVAVHPAPRRRHPCPLAPAGQAAALVLYTLIGLASTALVLSIAVPQVRARRLCGCPALSSARRPKQQRCPRRRHPAAPLPARLPSLRTPRSQRLSSLPPLPLPIVLSPSPIVPLPGRWAAGGTACASCPPPRAPTTGRCGGVGCGGVGCGGEGWGGMRCGGAWWGGVDPWPF